MTRYSLEHSVKLTIMVSVLGFAAACASTHTAQTDQSAQIKEALAVMESHTAKLGEPTVVEGSLLFGTTRMNENYELVDSLQAAGFTNLVSFQDPADNVRQLMKGEVKLSIFTDITIPEIARNAGYGIEDLEPVFTVKNNYFYIAISRGTPREAVAEWQSVLNDMKEDGTFAAIYGKYLPRAEIGNLVSQR